jgi:hypothetical protein
MFLCVAESNCSRAGLDIQRCMSLYSAEEVEVDEGLGLEALMCYRVEVCENYSSNRVCKTEIKGQNGFVGCV